MFTVTFRQAAKLFLLGFLLTFNAGAIFAQMTTFTYQGRLTDGGTPANGTYDLQFALWDSLSGGTLIGSTQTVSSVSVTGGIFTVTLDFGSNAFPGANRFLEIGVRISGGGAFTTLAPREQISSTPYAMRTLGAGAADALSNACVGCVQDSNISSVGGSKINGLIPVASVPAGSGNYIQNTANPQNPGNFNISGTGTIGGNLIANGNVGIGTTNPTDGRLQVEGGSGNGVVGKSSGQYGVYGLSGTGSGVVGTSTSGYGVYGSSGSGLAGVYGQSTSVTGVYGTSITSYGVYGVSTSGYGVYGVSSSNYAGFFQGNVHVNGTASVAGNVCAANIMCTSDVRLKQDIRPLSYGLRELEKLHPVMWHWKDTTTGQLNLGLVAQEVEPVLPELLLRDVDHKGPLGLSYMGLIPVLVKGIQEQQAQIKKQQERIEQQQAAVKREQEQLRHQQLEIEALKKVLCQRHRNARVCK